MRRRLIALFLGLVAVLLLAVEVPLAASYAQARTQELLIDRTGDTSRLARLAAPALARDAVRTLQPELRAYGELYGVLVQVHGPDGELLLSSAPDAPEAAAADSMGQALAGRRSSPPPTVLPWRTAPVAVAEPVLRGSEVAGAVVTVSPTGRVVQQVVVHWALLAAAGLFALALVALATAPLSRWILRPVHRLDDAVHTLTTGDLDARAKVGPGPPELRRLIADFNRMAEAIRTSSAQQRALVADVSHRLRNPLTALQLRVDALEAGLVPGARADHRLAMAEIERLTQVLDDTLAMARAEDDASPLVAVDVRECVRDRLRMWSDAAAAGNTEVLLTGAGTCWVLAPRGALDQVLDAVLSNALRFTRGGTVDVQVELTGDAEVEVRVVDDGPGLTPEECAVATRRFWRAPDQQNVPGSGLGLAIATALTERCGGRLAVSPARPHGLCVAVRLPRLDAAPSPVRPAPAAQPPLTPGLAAR
ncbi:HAMP domain-containing sensor histidine kinase [Modestobacter sp. VKM Ac-2979]|uniref:HAMP domain-containing sensor histidine kinase n=1 Tax=unclassified Modestobacter TaxID=2643866 RepID=UPI0022ABBF6D|nr:MULTISPECIES: HAMP domain-containing sensor histidine kinase [unclassified Modestobacter]MCZ2814322.1 HAMP domain-containing sensor histidine kinase [Modestobacter sp. VKM Ac-2979]MCZ2843986.1 HAMP domain-containing sensor histidine kinase [Modestobacter sp. VKM Ac-2980]